MSNAADEPLPGDCGPSSYHTTNTPGSRFHRIVRPERQVIPYERMDIMAFHYENGLP